PATGQPPFTNPGTGVPPLPADESRGYPPAEPKWKPAPDAGFKPPILGDLRDPKATLRPPQVGESQRPADPRADTSDLPVDIPQFGFARKGVASGQKPFVDGLDWLRTKGY